MSCERFAMLESVRSFINSMIFKQSNTDEESIYYEWIDVQEDVIEEVWEEYEYDEECILFERLISPDPFLPAFISKGRNLTADDIRSLFDGLVQEFPNAAVIDPSYFPEKNDNHLDEARFKRDKTLLQRLNSAEFILCPIHLDNHWYLTMVKKVSKDTFSIQSLDGLNRTHKHPIFNERVKKVLEVIYGHQKFKFIGTPSIKVAPQNNPKDCGLVAYYYALQALNGKDLNWFQQFSEGDYRPLRSHCKQYHLDPIAEPTPRSSDNFVIEKGDSGEEIICINDEEDVSPALGSSSRPVCVR